MVENCFSVGIFCVCGALISIILKQYCAEEALAVSVGVCASVLICFVVMLDTPITQLRSMMLSAGMSEVYISVIFKAIGICCITHISAELCRDSGEGAMAAAAELWGRGALIVIAIPVLEDFSRLLDNLM